MNKADKESENKEEILDEWEKELRDNWFGKKARRIILLRRFNRFSGRFRRFFVLSLILFFVYIIYKGLTAPPKYSEEETIINSERFEQLIQNTGQFKPRFEGALKILKQYPNYYQKVINNIAQIEITEKHCFYMCINTGIYYVYSNYWPVVAKGEIISDPILFINPKSSSAYQGDIEFASSLVHEADHVEFSKSDRWRKLALWLKCNPLVNPQISVDSYLPSIEHRIKPMEICAEKEEIKFHKLFKIPSQYEMGPGILSNFWYSIMSVFQLISSAFY